MTSPRTKNNMDPPTAGACGASTTSVTTSSGGSSTTLTRRNMANSPGGIGPLKFAFGWDAFDCRISLPRLEVSSVVFEKVLFVR